MLGKTTMSSRGTSKKAYRVLAHDRSRFRTVAVVGSETVPTAHRATRRMRFHPSIRRKRCNARAARRPARRSEGGRDPVRAPRHHSCDEDPALPETTSPVSCRAPRSSPPCEARRRPARPRSTRRASAGRARARSARAGSVRRGVSPAGTRRRPWPPDASQSARHSEVMSQAVVYLPTPNVGSSSTRTGIREESVRVA